MKFSTPIVALVSLLLAGPEQISGFSSSPSTGIQKNVMTSSSVALKMSEPTNDGERRAFLSKIVGATAAFTASTFVPALSQPAMAFGGALKKVNSQLSGFGLPTLSKLPDGFSPLLEIYGKGKNRVPLLVEFLYPSEWIVVLPNLDLNSEDGTIQAGQFSAGDTATFFVLDDNDQKIDDISAQSKEFYTNVVTSAISQKSSNIYQDFKITKIEQIEGEVKGQKYTLVDFKYGLLTGAGFEVDRKGVASITHVGSATQVLWCASTRQRYKKTEDSLRTIASSFRVFGDGLDLAVKEYQKEFDD